MLNRNETIGQFAYVVASCAYALVFFVLFPFTEKREGSPWL